jgi:hypothetical protein
MKTNTMKLVRLIALVLALVLCVSLSSCVMIGGGVDDAESETLMQQEFTIKDFFRSIFH